MAIYDGPILDYPMEVIRGWPNDGALDLSETISASATGASALNCGNVVTRASNGTVTLCVTGTANPQGIVVRGNGDTPSVTASTVGTEPGVYGPQALVIWGNCIFRTTVYNTASTFAPGTQVTGVNGVIDVWTAGSTVLGTVASVYPASGSNPASLLIIMN